MRDRDKSRKQLVKELKKLRRQLTEWERRDAERRPATTELPRPTGYLSADLIMVLDRERRFLTIAGPWLERFGLTPERFISRPVRDFLAPTAFTRFEAVFHRALSGRDEVYDCPWTVSPLPEARHLQLALAPLRDAQGIITGVVGVGRDVTEGVRLGVQQFQEHKLEAMSQMASGVAHHFNNLLTPILGFADLLLRHLRLDDPAREFAEQIRTAADRAATLLRPVQTFIGAHAINPQVVDLASFLNDLGPSLRAMAGANIRLVLAPAPGLWPVRADPAPLAQMLLHLARNACDAMPHGGVLTLAAANTAEGWVQLTVSDTGVGMSEEVLGRLFEPFFTTKELNQRTGLGLAMVHGIVKQHGGWIEAASQPGRGTTFTIALPRA